MKIERYETEHFQNYQLHNVKHRKRGSGSNVTWLPRFYFVRCLNQLWAKITETEVLLCYAVEIRGARGMG